MNHNTSFLLYPSGKTTYLRCRISSGKKSFTFNITQIDPTKWSKETQRCRKNSMHGKRRNISAAVINHKLGEIETAVDGFFNTNPDDFDTDKLRTFLNEQTGYPKHTQSDNLQINDIYTRFTIQHAKEESWATGTFMKHESTRKSFKQFLDEENLTDITIPKLTPDILRLYTDFLIRNENCNQTIIKKFSFIKTFLSWADAKGYGPTRKEVYDYKPNLNTEEDDIIFLDEDEFKVLYEFPFDKPGQKHLDRIRDVFCFCCLTSLRYSDVAKMTRNNIRKRVMSIGATKTRSALSINLGDKALAILDKYKDLPDDHPLPVVASQRSNEYIKKAAKLCGINSIVRIVRWVGPTRTETFHPKHEVISFHASRRTFISIAIMNGISPHTVMKFSGHKDYKSMQPYINIADKARKETIAIFDNI